ncbi:MAG: glycosyltransferase [Proteobacteria bacterium]|nr:MAG: glycosyltransferase [Pseudomonadota bacterium]
MPLASNSFIRRCHCAGPFRPAAVIASLIVYAPVECQGNTKHSRDRIGRKECRGMDAYVGAMFAFHAGELRQAPPRMQRIGMEWAFRLASEPRRLWRRYLVGNSRFVGLIARAWLTRQNLPDRRANR